MKPSSFSCALRANEHREPEEGHQRVALLGDVVEREHAREQQHAEPHEGDGGPLRCSALPKTQPATISTKITGRDPLVSRHRAHAGEILARRRGGLGRLPDAAAERASQRSAATAAIATSDGTEEARSQLPKPILSPAFCAICTPIGLAEVAVIQSAEESARPAIEQNMR